MRSATWECEIWVCCISVAPTLTVLSIFWDHSVIMFVVNHKMLKISPDKIAKPLLIIFNESSQQSKYPSNWKVFESNCGRVTYYSSSLDIKLKYLFNNSHLSESS
jgi:hypothetical protein